MKAHKSDLEKLAELKLWLLMQLIIFIVGLVFVVIATTLRERILIIGSDQVQWIYQFPLVGQILIALWGIILTAFSIITIVLAIRIIIHRFENYILNERKILWGLLVFLFGLFALVLFIYLAKKTLKDQNHFGWL